MVGGKQERKPGKGSGGNVCAEVGMAVSKASGERRDGGVTADRYLKAAAKEEVRPGW